jgi:enoyl-CoA hydratase/carnithine racemase
MTIGGQAVGRATYLAISCRSVSAEEALSLGLVDGVVDPTFMEKRSREEIKEISSSDPEAVGVIKRVIASERLNCIEEGFRLIAESAKREKTGRRIRDFLLRR